MERLLLDMISFGNHVFHIGVFLKVEKYIYEISNTELKFFFIIIILIIIIFMVWYCQAGFEVWLLTHFLSPKRLLYADLFIDLFVLRIWVEISHSVTNLPMGLLKVKDYESQN